MHGQRADRDQGARAAERDGVSTREGGHQPRGPGDLGFPDLQSDADSDRHTISSEAAGLDVVHEPTAIHQPVGRERLRTEDPSRRAGALIGRAHGGDTLFHADPVALPRVADAEEAPEVPGAQNRVSDPEGPVQLSEVQRRFGQFHTYARGPG